MQLSEVYRVSINLGEIFEFLVLYEVLIYLFINELITYWTPDIIKNIIDVENLITYSESTSMNYPRSQFSKPLQYFRRSCGHC